MTHTRTLLYTTLAVMALTIIFVSPVARSAADFTVNSLGDTPDASPGNGVCDDGTGHCTLRAAIEEANLLAGDDTINFSVTGTINLGSELPHLSTDMTINGPGARSLSVRGNGNFRIFHIRNGATVFISGLTVTNGSEESGGGIRVGTSAIDAGTLTLTRVAVTGNTAESGGGIRVGGDCSLTIIESEISDNHASPLNGTGAGILSGGTLLLVNSTVSGNVNPGGAAGGGGGLFVGGPTTLTGSTIANNTATETAGIIVQGPAATIRNTIIADNISTQNLNCPDVSGNFRSDGYNLIENTGVPGCATITPNPGAGPDITGVDPQLQPLFNNGGPTDTHALSLTSPAIDKGKNFTTMMTDQRGFPRPVDFAAKPNAAGGDGSDIGAYELIVTPASKDECKNGGWKNLFRADGSSFKNQGDCIQYVNTGK